VRQSRFTGRMRRSMDDAAETRPQPNGTSHGTPQESLLSTCASRPLRFFMFGLTCVVMLSIILRIVPRDVVRSSAREQSGPGTDAEPHGTLARGQTEPKVNRFLPKPPGDSDDGASTQRARHHAHAKIAGGGADIASEAGTVIPRGPVFHVLITRFQQFQAKLRHLAEARFELFRSFCFQSVLHQTATNFIWIIVADPELHAEVRADLVGLVQPHRNFFLVPTNEAHQVFFADRWVNTKGNEGGKDMKDFLPGELWHGDRGTLLTIREQIVKGAYSVFLTTRLDADDGLNAYYLQYLQDSAKEALGQQSAKGTRQSWKIWCANKMIEWHSNMAAKGQLVQASSPGFCPTPGLSFAVAAQSAPALIGDTPHHVLFKLMKKRGKAGDCGASNRVSCLEQLENLKDGGHSVTAIRARTPTSHGLQGVDGEAVKSNSDGDSSLWSLVEEEFGIRGKMVGEANAAINKDLTHILEDNAQGQCTPGHSCKHDAADKLFKLTGKKSKTREEQTEATQRK